MNATTSPTSGSRLPMNATTSPTNATATPTCATGPPTIPSSAIGGTKRQQGTNQAAPNGCGRGGDLRVTAQPLAPLPTCTTGPRQSSWPRARGCTPGTPAAVVSAAVRQPAPTTMRWRGWWSKR
jgi:hypothetical protein